MTSDRMYGGEHATQSEMDRVRGEVEREIRERGRPLAPTPVPRTRAEDEARSELEAANAGERARRSSGGPAAQTQVGPQPEPQPSHEHEAHLELERTRSEVERELSETGETSGRQPLPGSGGESSMKARRGFECPSCGNVYTTAGRCAVDETALRQVGPWTETTPQGEEASAGEVMEKAEQHYPTLAR